MTTTADPSTEEHVGRFASLHLPVYRRLLIGGTFSFLSMMISVIARGWLAFDLTGTNTALGGVMIGFGFSSIIMIPLGGVLADRFPKRRVLLVTAGLQTVVSLVLATAAVTDVIEYWMLVVASIVQGAVISMLGPARLAFIAESVDRDRLTNGILLSQSTLQLTRVIGPALAGVLIGVQAVGIGGVYYIAAACALAGLVTTIRLPEGRPIRPPSRSPRADLIDGVRFVRANPRIAHLLVLSYLVVLIGFPYIAFLPVMAEDIFDAGSTGFGLLTTTGAVGALIASLALADVAPTRVERLQSGAAIGFGISLVLFGLAPVFAVALAIMLFVGATSGSFQSLNNSLVLTMTPVEYHGRIQSLLMLGFSGFGLAALPFGLIADAVGLRETLVAMGVLVTVIATISAVVRLRRAPRPAATL
ncbi:MAG: MFS transporter [Ilumatobacteraceae bacterium]